MPDVKFEMRTSLSVEKVTSMLTDFSDRRPDIWPGLWRGAYRVYSVGDTTAEIQEGNQSPKVWARERYDWSRPGVVRWEVVESNFCKPSSFVEVQMHPDQSGGTILQVHWSRSPTNLMGAIAGIMIKLTGGAPVKASLAAGLRRAEGEATTASA